MHISMRYGNKDGVPVNHLSESLDEGRVSPRGLANQGWLKKTINNLQLTSPNEKVSIDLRASNDQIVAVGELDPNSYDTTPDMWSGDTSYRRTWGVEWTEVFRKPLTQSEFCDKYSIEDGKLKKQFHHAQHSWVSPNLTISLRKQTITTEWKKDNYNHIKEGISSILALDFFIAMDMEHDDYLLLKKMYEVGMSVLDKYPKQETEMSDEWRKNLVTKKATKKTKKKKKTSRTRITKAQKKERSFAKKMRKIISEAQALGIDSDYAMAKYFSKKGYARRDGKRSWYQETVGVYRTKYVLDKAV